MRKLFLLVPVIFFLRSVFPATAQVLIRDSAFVASPSKALVRDPLALNFIAMGDWGRNGDDHQKEVARQMGKTARDTKAQFVVATGDNFYPSGVISKSDPLFKYSFEDIYTDFSLQWDWYVILGNHDYKSNPDAQVEYSSISRRWKMPARYYSKTFNINNDPSQKVLMLFIDTNPLIPEFYKNPEYGPNVKGQDTTKQKRWLEKMLQNAGTDVKWKIVVGHHPMFTGGSRTEGYDTKAIRNSLKPVLDKYKVDVYLTGHEHSLQYIKPPGATHHFISGSASEATPARLVDHSKLSASDYGFMLFSVSTNQLRVQAINYEGKILYHTLIKK
ncbi:purple acid phosphatase family protein [Desertivirga brevis]|uniref:purple acid phosphatase family protein n=1 Tax=Desertivirga brevis TaxID=2810310 RepID=UPI001A96E955|nr:tartrate-resistant acid phosphatase type 5 family protein [Pedobacter sp. SYSU D00873]